MLTLFSSRLIGRRGVTRDWRRAADYLQATGFTLLELLTVITLIAIVTALLIGGARRAVETGAAARAKAELALLAVGLEEYHRVCGDYPQTNDGAILLQALIGRRGPHQENTAIRSLIELARFTTVAALDPFTNADAVLSDPWGRPYRYAYKSQMPWSNFSYVLYSVGPDGRDSALLLPGGLLDPAPVENADNLSVTSY